MSEVKISMRIPVETEVAANAILSRYGLSLNESVLVLLQKDIADGGLADLPESVQMKLAEAAEIAAEEGRHESRYGE